MWNVYIVKCADASLYAGITTDLQRRLNEHNSSSLGAKYTKHRRPVEFVWAKTFANRAGAAKEEYRIKKLSREEKIILIGKNKQKIWMK